MRGAEAGRSSPSGGGGPEGRRGQRGADPDGAKPVLAGAAPSVAPRQLPQRGSISVSAAALTEARQWLGTPYRHQASLRGVACDCLGLVRGLWRALYGDEPEAPPPYRPDWAEVGAREILLEALGRWLISIDVADVKPGDVLVFRMTPDAVVKHCAILSADDRMIHAYWGRACVESWLGRWWRERLVGAFRFPDLLLPCEAGEVARRQ